SDFRPLAETILRKVRDCETQSPTRETRALPGYLQSRTVKSDEHLFLTQHFEQMVEAWAGVAACYRKTSRMHNHADLDPEFFCRRFHHRFNFTRGETFDPRECAAHGLKSRHVFGREILSEAFRIVIK